MTTNWASDDDVPVPAPEPAEAVEVDYTGTRLPRDLTGADWGDTSGDHRWRSLDPTFVPGTPLEGWKP